MGKTEGNPHRGAALDASLASVKKLYHAILEPLGSLVVRVSRSVCNVAIIPAAAFVSEGVACGAAITKECLIRPTIEMSRQAYSAAAEVSSAALSAIYGATAWFRSS